MIKRLVFNLIENWYLKQPNNKVFYCQKTKVYNQNWWELYAKEHFQDEEFNIVILDLNNFKEYNDTFGHSKGDNFLKGFAHYLKLLFVDGYICRIGGDEFIVITKMSPTKIALSLNVMDGYNFSYGIRHKDASMSLEEAYEDVDERMYTYKRRYKEKF